MPSRTAAATRRPTSAALSPTAALLTPAPALTAGADPALDEALERISDLAARLWAVRSAHRPVAVGWRRTHTRCAGCGQALPCATLLAAG